MSKRLLTVAAVLALVVAACGGAEVVETTTSAAPAEEPVAPTTQVAPEPEVPKAPEGQPLSYSFEAGTEYRYEVDLDQQISMTSSIEGPVTAESEELPSQADINLGGSAVFTYAVAAGPSEGTYEITITGEFTDVELSGTFDGLPIDTLADGPDVTDLAGLEPINTTIVVDEQGNLVVDGKVVDDPFAGMFGGLDSLGAGSAPGLEPGQFIGVPFPDDEVHIDDSWTEKIETPGLGEDPIVTTISSTVTDIVEGVYVIDTETSTTPIEFDLGEFFIGLMTAFGTPEGEDAAEFDATIEQIRFVMKIDDASSRSTTRFHSGTGLVNSYSLDGGAHINMDINVPDETTGELSGMQVDMRVDQQLTYELVNDPSA